MEGRIIEFIEDGKLFCAICLEEKAGRLRVLTSKNKEMNISTRRVLSTSSKVYPKEETKESLLAILRQAEERREQLKSEVDIRELWEAVNDQEDLGFRDLAELVFGYGIGDEHISAVIRALFEDRVYFRLREKVFSPVPPEKVEEHFQRLEEEEKLRQKILRLQEGIGRLLSQGLVDDEIKNELIELLKELALYDKEAKDYELIKEIFQSFGGPDPRKAKEILQSLGVWAEDEDLELLRSTLQRDFPPGITEEAIRLRRLRNHLNGREDLRGVTIFTIDGPKTKDFDDAISLEKIPQGYRLGIHISDVSCVVLPDSKIDKVIMERVSSLYLPTRYIPMMPPELSEDGLSLVEGLDRPCISLLIEIDKDFQVKAWQFVPSVVRVEKQLTYDQVDQAMEYEEVFEILSLFSEHLRKKRLEQGGLDLTLPEVVLAYRPDGRLELFQVDLSSPSRRIVQEIMILYNKLAARFLVDQGIPALFRVQEGPTERFSESDMDRILYVFLQRRKLMPLLITTSYGPHVPLGVDSYVQVSSPIRRYLDLVVQRQISAALKNRALPYDTKALEYIKATTEPILKEQEKVRRASFTYWLLRYFQQNQEKTFHGLVLDELKSRLRVIIKEALFVVEAKREVFKGGVSQGDELLIKVTKVDPWTGQIEIAGA